MARIITPPIFTSIEVCWRRCFVNCHLIFSFLLVCLFVVPASAFPAKVIKTTDGDTITVLTPTYQQIRVRLYGIDCPERRQPFGTVATRFVRERVAGKEVEVTVMGTDRYGRTIGLVGDLNQALLEAGLAWVYPQYCRKPFCRDWKRIEAQVREAGRGLWQDTNPIPPWDWRKSKNRK